MRLAHDDVPVPGELWAGWSPDPLVLVALLVLAAAHERGRGREPRWRSWCFRAAVVVLAVALVSPLARLAAALASAHMVQHLLLTLVAAPLLALAAPSAALLRGAPPVVPAALTRLRRVLRLTSSTGHLLRRPEVAWLLAVGTLWAWHAAVLYQAALDRPAVHALEHATFLVTALLFWRVVVGTRAVRVSPGLAVLLLFTMSVQSALLSLLLTFAEAPWYPGYTTTTRPWGLEQLADQRLAGAIMWVPAGFVYLGAALALVAGWLRGLQRQDGRPVAPVPDAPALLARR